MDLWKEFSEAATSLFPGVAVNKKNVRCGTMPELGSTPLMSQFLVFSDCPVKSLSSWPPPAPRLA